MNKEEALAKIEEVCEWLKQGAPGTTCSKYTLGKECEESQCNCIWLEGKVGYSEPKLPQHDRCDCTIVHGVEDNDPDVHKIARNMCDDLLSAADVDDMGGCPLCQG